MGGVGGWVGGGWAGLGRGWGGELCGVCLCMRLATSDGGAYPSQIRRRVSESDTENRIRVRYGEPYPSQIRRTVLQRTVSESDTENRITENCIRVRYGEPYPRRRRSGSGCLGCALLPDGRERPPDAGTGRERERERKPVPGNWRIPSSNRLGEPSLADSGRGAPLAAAVALPFMLTSPGRAPPASRRACAALSAWPGRILFAARAALSAWPGRVLSAWAGPAGLGLGPVRPAWRAGGDLEGPRPGGDSPKKKTKRERGLRGPGPGGDSHPSRRRRPRPSARVPGGRPAGRPADACRSSLRAAQARGRGRFPRGSGASPRLRGSEGPGPLRPRSLSCRPAGPGRHAPADLGRPQRRRRRRRRA